MNPHEMGTPGQIRRNPDGDRAGKLAYTLRDPHSGQVCAELLHDPEQDRWWMRHPAAAITDQQPPPRRGALWEELRAGFDQDAAEEYARYRVEEHDRAPEYPLPPAAQLHWRDGYQVGLNAEGEMRRASVIAEDLGGGDPLRRAYALGEVAGEAVRRRRMMLAAVNDAATRSASHTADYEVYAHWGMVLTTGSPVGRAPVGGWWSAAWCPSKPLADSVALALLWLGPGDNNGIGYDRVEIWGPAGDGMPRTLVDHLSRSDLDEDLTDLEDETGQRAVRVHLAVTQPAWDAFRGALDFPFDVLRDYINQFIIPPGKPQ